MPVRCSLDSNILIYAALEPGSEKGQRAADVIRMAAPHGVLAVQALLEFIAVVRRRAPELTARAVDQAAAWATVFEIAPTDAAVLAGASRLVTAHRFQVWDAVIWSAARAAGATVLVTEDLQDGLTLEAMTVINPFQRSSAEIEALLTA